MTLADQIRQRWGQYGDWKSADQDQVADLARLLEANGITDLSQLQFSKRDYDLTSTDSGSEGRDASTSTQRRTTFDVRYGDRDLGFLGDINRDGSVSVSGRGELTDRGDAGPILGWSSRGGGNTNYRLVEDPKTGQVVVVPTWGSSKTGSLQDARAAATIAAMAYGGYMLDPASGAAASGTTAGGMSGSELATFLEANAGALAPGAEVATGYGTTWGVGADGIIGSGATMTADGVAADQVLNTYGGNASGSPADAPAGAPGTGNTPTTPDANKPTPDPNKPGWTTRDTLRTAGDALKVIGSTTGGGGGGGGDGSMENVDPRLMDAQLRSMDTQDALLQRMISNADMIMPFQRDAMEFGLRTAREAYSDYRDDRQYALGRRAMLTGLQDQAVADARAFNTDERRTELRGRAVADVNQAWSGALDSAQRTMTRTGRDGNDGRWGSTIRQMVADKTLAQVAAANNADTSARAEGRGLVDRAAGLLRDAPVLAGNATGAGAGAGASGVPLAGQSLQMMQGGLQTAAGVAGQWGNNATNMAQVQARNGGSSGGNTDWSAAGALLAGLTKAYDAFSR